MIEKGAVDRIIPRQELRQEIIDLLCMLTHKPRPTNMQEVDAIPSPKPVPEEANVEVADTDNATETKE